MEWRRPPYLVSDAPERLDGAVIHDSLTRSDWARGVPRETVERSLRHSLCLGLYRLGPERPGQIGLARLITDRTTFAYLCDVFVLEEERGRGLGKFLIECVHAHPELQGLRRWLLVTPNAHGLYARFGWRVPPEPGKFMERVPRDRLPR